MIKQPVAAGNGLCQFLKSFSNETTVGFSTYLCQLLRHNAITPITARITLAIQKTLEFSNY